MTSSGSEKQLPEVEVEIASAVREACLKVALDAYENAQMDGLCHEGAWEVAVGAIQALDVERVVRSIIAEESSWRGRRQFSWPRLS